MPKLASIVPAVKATDASAWPLEKVLTVPPVGFAAAGIMAIVWKRRRRTRRNGPVRRASSMEVTEWV
jgi:hypothetical protein